MGDFIRILYFRNEEIHVLPENEKRAIEQPLSHFVIFQVLFVPKILWHQFKIAATFDKSTNCALTKHTTTMSEQSQKLYQLVRLICICCNIPSSC